MPTLFQAPSQASKKKNEKSAVLEKIPGNHASMKPLAAFVRSPDGVRFETQEAEETVELFLRQHPVVNIPWIITSLILIVAPVLVFPFIFRSLPLPVIPPARYVFIGTIFWYLGTFGFILTNFLYWFFNIYIVTNERLVDIDFMYLLYKRFSEAELNKIQDLSFTSGGLLAAVFDYGSVEIETAGEAPNLIFEKIPHPEKVVETIRSLSELEKHEPL